MFQFLYSLDIVSTIVFAMSGALLAVEHQRECSLSPLRALPCALLYSGLTALGGGTLRDLLLSRPIFWIRSPAYLYITLFAGGLTFFLSIAVLKAPSYFKYHLWLPDAISLATFTVVGTQVAMQQPIVHSYQLLQGASLPFPWLLCPFMGVLTGLGGGFVRDVLRRQRPFAVQHSQYPLASLVGGSLYKLTSRLHILPDAIAIGLAIVLIVFMLCAFMLRAKSVAKDRIENRIDLRQ